tara:strand:+ start:774 stop:1073 length:300 start_codon:yes stop_codon:yes gene_type:complete
MDVVNKPVKIGSLQVGDEVIVRGIDLNYMIVNRLPKKVKRSYTYSPLNGQGNVTNTYETWTKSKCTRDHTVWGYKEVKDVYFDFSHKDIWLVKRVGINK